MSEELLLGLDLGTTSCKAAVVTLEGEEVAHGQAPLEWQPVPTGAEIAPLGFVDCARAAAREALDAAPRGSVAGVGVSSMAETGILLDGRGEPGTPSIAWHASRGEEAAARVRSRRRAPGTTRAARGRRSGSSRRSRTSPP